MRKIAFIGIILAALQAYSQDCYTIIVNPGVDASREARISWHSSQPGRNVCQIFEASDSQALVATLTAKQEFVSVFDSIRSKSAAGADIVECPSVYRYALQAGALRPGTEYRYRIGDAEGAFKTAPESGEEWMAAIISDFHSYAPLPGRQRAAMAMLDTLKSVNGGDFDLLLHVGDVCAWGGSYSFWRDLYAEPNVQTHMVAGVIGNHDHMSRGYDKNTSDYFKYANNNPLNGYHPQEGVCYFFKYGDTLFAMLSSEAMRSDEGLETAQQWLRHVVAANPAEHVVVMEHYQWFYGEDGRDAQYRRWHDVFDELGVDLAIGANNHIYARTPALRGGEEAAGGTVYVQTPSADNERGQDMGALEHNEDLIACRWTEGPRTVGAMLLKSTPAGLLLSLYDREGRLIDQVVAL